MTERCLLADCDFPMSETFTLAIARDCRCDYCRRLLLDYRAKEHPSTINTTRLEQKVAELSDLMKGMSHYLTRKQANPKSPTPQPSQPKTASPMGKPDQTSKGPTLLELPE